MLLLLAIKGQRCTLATRATGRWAVANPVPAQLLFWRPVPGYQPSAEAFAPAMQIIDLLRSALADRGLACSGCLD
jgi:hypothetical protein